MAERRQLERFEISISLNMRLLGVFTRPLTVNVRTGDVCFAGLSIELRKEEEFSDLIPYLGLENKEVALDMKIPPQGERIRAIGRVMWYDSSSRGASHYFRAGISLEEMEAEDRRKWEDFVKMITRKASEDSSRR